MAVCSSANVAERRLVHCDCSNKLSHHLMVLYDNISNTEAGANKEASQREQGTGSSEWDAIERWSR